MHQHKQGKKLYRNESYIFLHINTRAYANDGLSEIFLQHRPVPCVDWRHSMYYKCRTYGIQVSEWLLLNDMWHFFQLYHAENRLHFSLRFVSSGFLPKAEVLDASASNSFAWVLIRNSKPLMFNADYFFCHRRKDASWYPYVEQKSYIASRGGSRISS